MYAQEIRIFLVGRPSRENGPQMSANQTRGTATSCGASTSETHNIWRNQQCLL